MENCKPLTLPPGFARASSLPRTRCVPSVPFPWLLLSICHWVGAVPFGRLGLIPLSL